VSGTLVVGAPPQLAHNFLSPALPRFAAAHPDLDLDVRVIHRTTDADAEAVDVFLLHGWPEPQDLVHRKLGHARTVVAATPNYWAQHGLPQHPVDLTAHNCPLVRNPAGALLDLWVFERNAERVEVKVDGWLRSNDRELVLANVLAHQGVGRFNVLTTRAYLNSGELVPALIDWELHGGPPLNLLFRANHRRTPKVRCFVDFVMTLVEEHESSGGLAGKRNLVERPVWHGLRHGLASMAVRTNERDKAAPGSGKQSAKHQRVEKSPNDLAP
jgi:DNA-binding transcriptional LysR family regulator